MISIWRGGEEEEEEEEEDPPPQKNNKKTKPEVNGYRQLFCYQHSSKILLLCSTEDIHTGLEQPEGE